VHNTVYVNATNQIDSEVPINDIYEPSNLVAGQMNKVIDERRYVTFGSSQIKRLSEHESFCRMTILRAPTGAGSCGDNEFDISKLSTLMYTEPYPYGHRNIHLTAKNVEFALSDLCGTNGTMWLKIDGFFQCFNHEQVPATG